MLCPLATIVCECLPCNFENLQHQYYRRAMSLRRKHESLPPRLILKRRFQLNKSISRQENIEKKVSIKSLVLRARLSNDHLLQDQWLVQALHAGLHVITSITYLRDRDKWLVEQNKWSIHVWEQRDQVTVLHNRRFSFTKCDFNPFAPEPPVTARADPRPFYPLWRHKF